MSEPTPAAVPPMHGRRAVLGLTAALAGMLAAPTAEAAARIVMKPRSLAFEHAHTGETLSVTYWSHGRYLPGARRKINWLLRDFHTDEVRDIDPRLLDVLCSIQHRLGTTEPFCVLSAYRSPRTNALLAASMDGVAQQSFHTQGMAIDICMKRRSPDRLRKAAAALQAGGVGYYPDHGFVHVDVGPVRYW
jgi:uncharacterized protein YcbK (DUF882 family)